MTPLDRWLAEVEARRKRCVDVLDVGGTEQALIGNDIDALLALLRRAVEGLEAIASDQHPAPSIPAQQALADLVQFALEGGEVMNHEKIYRLAVRHGCTPFWWDGIFGEAWHCGCDDLRHACDQQCSMIDEKSAKKKTPR